MSADHTANAGKLERRLFILAACAGTIAVVFALVVAAGGTTVSTLISVLP